MIQKIVITHPIHPDVRNKLEVFGEVCMNTHVEPWTAEVLHQHLSGATAMMAFMTDTVDQALLESASNLKVVACALKGFDNFDVQACTAKNIWVTIVPDLLTASTAELAIGLAISLGRHILPGDQLIRHAPFNGWRPQLYGKGLDQSCVAILGMGMVGQAIAQRLSGFGCKEILGVDPVGNFQGVTFCSLSDAMRHADFVFVAIPLTHDSIDMLGHEQFMLCKSGQVIINVGRGSVVNESAIVDALEEGRVAGYAADVFACEDWTLIERPTQIDPRLLNHPNTVFTPHLGSAVREVRLAIEHRAADNIIAVLRGEIPMDAINTAHS